jgi:hypothetical protein
MLVLAVFLQALTDLASVNEPNKRSAEEWVQCTEDTGAFSFFNSCLAFGIDPDAAREAIKDKRSPYLCWKLNKLLRCVTNYPRV